MPRQTRRIRATKAQQDELLSYLKQVREKYISNLPAFVPGYSTFELKQNVHLIPWRKILHAGLYLTPSAEGLPADSLPDEYTRVFTIAPDMDDIQRQLEADMAAQDGETNDNTDGDAAAQDGETDENGVAYHQADEQPVQIGFNVEPILLEENRQLDFMEIVVWGAIADAENDGDSEKAHRIFELAYPRDPNKAPNLPAQDTITPRQQYDPDTRVANTFTDKRYFDEAGVVVDIAGRGKNVDVAVSFSVDEGVELSRDISAYDREVHRAVSSRWVAGNRNFTVSQIAKDMGMPKPTPKQLKKVEESIELQRRILGRIDFSEQAKGRNLHFDDGTPITEFIVDGHLFELEGITMRGPNGHEVKGYRMKDAPLLYRHAAAVREVVSYPQRWLEFGKGSTTDTTLLIRAQILRQVKRFTSANWKKKNKGTNIRFITDPEHPGRGSLFSRAGVNEKDRDARKKATDFAVSVLEDLVQDGAIKGFKLNQKTVRGGKKSTYGVTVKL